MLTTKIINAAEKARPFEQKLRVLYSKKAPRLITLGVIAAAVSLVYWNITKWDFYFQDFAITIGFIALIYLAITFGAGFFANIGKFSLMKFTIANLGTAFALFAVEYLLSLSFIDLSVENPYLLMLKGSLYNNRFTYIPAIILSLLTGLLLSRKKTSNAE